MTLALAGNQNSGKTTLFNRLTGENQRVGNWPGVTVERRAGTVQLPDGGTAELIDLPGVYSLSPYTPEERVARDYLAGARPDAIVNCVDAAHIERGLYLTLQLLRLRRPVVVALTMMDAARGLTVDLPALSEALGAPVLAVSARRGDGVDALLRAAAEAARAGEPPRALSLGGAADRALGSVQRQIAGQAGDVSEYAAERLLEGDAAIADALGLDSAAREAVESAALRLERESGMDRVAALAHARYRYVEQALARCVRGRPRDRADRVDALLLRSALAYPAFAGLLLTVFYLTFGPPGARLTGAFARVVEGGVALLSGALSRWGAAPWARELLIDGALTGVGSVLRFLPTLTLLLLLLSLLEDSGYLARAAFLMDRPLRRLGLSGRAFIPLLLGFGCTVPAAMSARSLQPAERRRAVLLLPFMSCGAKAPVYALLAGAFLPAWASAATIALYALGVLAGIGAARLTSRAGGRVEPFLMELPPYRMPSARNVLRQLRERAGEFITRAFTVVFLATLAVWFLGRFTPALTRAESLESSLLGRLGGLIAPLLRPAGFGNARAAAALMSGWLAKESVVSTLTVLCGEQGLTAAFPTALSAASFLAFTLLYAPCAAACAAMRRELESLRWTLISALGQTALAWAVAVLLYQIGLLLGF